MTSVPFFSIVIPAYNCEAFIHEALDSIKLQSCNDWEILIAADITSTDGTVHACTNQTIISEDRINVVHVGHIGQYAARRLLVESSKGEVVISLDADDQLIVRDALQRIKDSIQREGCDMVIFNATKSPSQGERIVDYSSVCADSVGEVDVNKLVRHMLFSYDLNNVCLKAFKRSKASFFSGDRVLHNTEDRLQCIELLSNITSCYLINEPFYYYRPNENSVTQSKYKYSYFEDALYVEAKANELLLPLCECESLMWKRKCFLSTTVAMLLQMLFESSGNKEYRLQMYESIRNYGLKLKILPENAGRIRFDYAIVYKQFIEGRFRTLDDLLSLRAKARLRFSDRSKKKGK